MQVCGQARGEYRRFKLGKVLGVGKYHRTHYAIDMAEEKPVIVRILDESALQEATARFKANKLVSQVTKNQFNAEGLTAETVRL